MPHLGKPYPYPIHRDVMMWLTTPTQRMAKSYTLQYSLNGPTGSCELISRVQASEPIEYLYTNDIVARWRWQQPCPSAWYFYLELILSTKVEDFAWRWSIWQGGIQYRHSSILTMTNPPSNPHTQPSNLWTQDVPGGKFLAITVPPSPTPW
jgi:hypothetical protein